MPRVFTVYNCGTGFDRTHTDELIANLAERTKGSENRDWMITDGVGPNKVKFAEGYAPTLRERALQAAAKVPGSRSAQATTQQGYSALNGEHKQGARWFNNARGTTAGHGWEHNVQHAMDVITALLVASKEPPEVINMAGWSRGAITCHMLAHALYKEPATRNLPVNLFAADPVTGPKHDGELDKKSLPPNVRRYLAVMQRHEARGIMRPTVLKNFVDLTNDIKDKVLTMPGLHDTGVMMLKSEVGLMTAHLAHKFLTRHGTELRDPIRLSPRDMCELYAQMRIKYKTYRKSIWKDPQRLLGTHKRKDLEFKSDRDSCHYFINEHHMKQFELLYPLQMQRMEGKVFSMARLQPELRRMRGEAPTTFKSLTEINAI